MYFPNILAFTTLALSASLVAARPIACDPRTLDMILMGEMPKNACCSYGVCIGDVNVSGG